MKYVLSLFAILVSTFSIAQEQYHRAKIYYNSLEQFLKLQESGVSLDHGTNKDNQYFISDFSENELRLVNKLGFTYDIIINDVQQFYADQNNPESKHYVSLQDALAKQQFNCATTTNPDEKYPTPKNFNLGSMEGYLTYSETMQELDDMYQYCQDNGINILTKRADLINPDKPNDLKTEEGRLLQWLKLSDNPESNEEDEPDIFLNAIHHSREPTSLQQLIFFMWYVIENYKTDPHIRALVDNTEMIIVPIVNPDGYIYVERETKKNNKPSLWRKNRKGGYGVDNNRNYSFINPTDGKQKWGTTGVSFDKKSDTYPGSGPFSEPETRAMQYLVEKYDFRIALNYHSHGNVFLFPYAYKYKTQTPDHDLFVKYAEAMAIENGYTNRNSSNKSALSGISNDYMYGELKKSDGSFRKKIFAYTPEIGTSFWLPKNTIINACKNMVKANLVGIELATNYGVVKDQSPESSTKLVFPVDFLITRYGMDETSNYTVSIEAISDNIESVGNPKTFNTIGLNKTKTDNITINLKNTIKDGQAFAFKLNLNNGFYTTSQTITKIYGTNTPIFEDNADNLEYWETDNWGLSTSEYKSAPSSISDSPNGNYNNNETNTITLKSAINLTSPSIQDAQLSFVSKWDIEDNFDYAQLELSTNNGDSWTPLCGKYTNLGTKDQNGATDKPVYDGIQADWIEEHISLKDYIGNSVKFRFKLVSDDATTKDGFYFDDLKVTVWDTSLSTNKTDLDTFFSIYPNPVKHQLTINSTFKNYTYHLQNIQGQLLTKGHASGKVTTIDYENYPNGIYLLKVTANNNQKTFKIVKQ